MRILIFHPTFLPPRDYGGIERVVLWLTRGLIENGHQVYVAALAGSRVPDGCSLIEAERKAYSAEELSQLFPKGLDIVHFMAPLADKVWSQRTVPALLTVHGNGQCGQIFPKNTVFLSQNHARRHGAEYSIYNGIDPSEYLYRPEFKENWFLFLSKTNWRVKNLLGAMHYCRSAEVSLKIAGGNRPFFQRLQCSMRKSMQWIGPVSGIQKANLLAQAKALIFPVLWPEPFGLVVAEALMSGTPVIASPRGSLVEMIPPDVGFLPQSERQWIEGLQGSFENWNPERCRQWALEKFHFIRMAENYEKAYQKVVSGNLLNEKNPVVGNWRNE